MAIIGAIQIILLSCGIALSITVIPRPNLDIEKVSPFSITVNWTLPKNELFDEFVVEMLPAEGDALEYEPMDMRRTYVNLTPGTLYTFIVRTVRDEEFSDEAVIIQDTIPLAPTDLELRYFDTLVLTLEGPYFQDTAFTVDAPGVEANWKESISGRSDCYYAGLEPDDGYQAIPGEKHEILKGDTMRQFIHLVPGKEYTVTIYASTCGEGHLGELKSDGISASIKIPPADPPAILVVEVTETTAELTWDDEPIEGFYDDFEIVKIGDVLSDVVIDTPRDTRKLGRNLSQLKPCTKHEFDVYTLFESRRSRNPRNVLVHTRPYPPTNVFVEDFTETSITLSWNRSNRNIVAGFSIEVSPSTSEPITTRETSVKIEGLIPGAEYTISVLSVCDNTENTMSLPYPMTQTTKPLPPQSLQQKCEYISGEPEMQRVRALYDRVPWEAPEPSRMNLTWTKPAQGSWDGYLVHYSPYQFEQGTASPASPVFLVPNTVSTQITIPVSGRVITASVRTVSRNVASEPLVKQIFCGGKDGESTLRCRSFLPYWTIKITPIDDNTRLLVEIPNYPIYNATVNMDDLNEVLLFYNNTFTIRNPCDDGPSSKITVYPRCPDFLPFCPVISRRICIVRGRGDPLVQPDACCNSRLYNTNDQICCHNKLLSKFDRKSEECCVSRWYDRRIHRCCGSSTTSAKSGTC